MRLQGHDFEVIHTSGSANPSDYMSRHPCFVNADGSITMADKYVNFLVSHAILKAMTLSDIQQATVTDTTLQCLVYLIQMDSWNDLNHLPGKFQDANIAELLAFQRVKRS